MSQTCGKDGSSQEIKQWEATKPKDNIIPVGGVAGYEKSTSQNQIREIEQLNVRAERYPNKFPKVNIADMEFDKVTDPGLTKSLASENYATGKYGPQNEKEEQGGYQEQGAVGEYLAECVLQDLGLKVEAFDKAYHGIDFIAIGKDSNDQYVIIEAKLSADRNGKGNLSTSKYIDEDGKEQSIKQLSEKWIETRLMNMEGKGKHTENSEQFTKENAILASKIREEMTKGNVRSLLVHTNINTLNIIVQEHDGKKDWTPVAGYRFNKFL